MITKSEQLYCEAQSIMPGGVNSPVRAFNSVGGTPIFMKRANGAYLFDVDDNCYIDYVGSWGSMILGHNNPIILKAAEDALKNGLSFGTPTPKEIDLAALITQLVPSIEMVRMVNSGTEATMSAIRVARGVTGKDKIIKFEGCYHGHADYLLVKAGSGALTFSNPTSPGVPIDFINHTLICNFNDLNSVKKVFQQYPDDIAAIIIEPIAGNMNCIPAKHEFLEGLRTLCDKYGALLIIDEVMTGFRVAPGGGQSYYQIEPDLTCLGKIIGGGMPVGAFGGKRKFMQQLSPTGPIYQAGTLSGNPIAMAAGYACLTQLANKPCVYEKLVELSLQLTEGLKIAAKRHGIPLVINQVGGMFGIFFTTAPEVTSYQGAIGSNMALFGKFFHHMLASGIYFAPSAFEAGFMSLAHTNADIDKTLDAANRFFYTL